jgi:hypothetical protein
MSLLTELQQYLWAWHAEHWHSSLRRFLNESACILSLQQHGAVRVLRCVHLRRIKLCVECQERCERLFGVGDGRRVSPFSNYHFMFLGIPNEITGSG